MKRIMSLSWLLAPLLAFGLAGCGGGNESSTPEAAGDPSTIVTTVSGDPGLDVALDVAPVYCDGVMFPGSKRWCHQDDGTVKDMTTNTVWLRDSTCSGPLQFRDALSWADDLSSGTCGLADGSMPGKWAMPDTSILALARGAEPVSVKAPKPFVNLGKYYDDPGPEDPPQYFEPWEERREYFADARGWRQAVTFASSDPSYGRFATDPREASFVLPYRRYPDNRAKTIVRGQRYALAAATAVVQVPGTTNLFTRRFINQIQWQFCCNAAYVVLWTWDDNSYFRTFRLWSFDDAGDGFYRIRTQGRYLAVRDASRSAGTMVIAWPSPSTYDTNDQWSPGLNAGDNTWYFVNKQSGMCLHWQSNVNEESLVQQVCAPGSPNQSFIAFPR